MGGSRTQMNELRTIPIQPKLRSLLKDAIALLKADKGNIQLYDEKENALTIVASHGFNNQFLEHFRRVQPGYAPCGTALKRKKRVVVEYAFSDRTFGHMAPIFASYGFVAIQST